VYQGMTLVCAERFFLEGVNPSEDAATSERAAYAREQAASESRDLLF
jgi:hypothetical protein